MATTTSITSTYAGEFAGKYISAALLSGSTIENGLITVKPNVSAGIGTLTEVNVRRDTTTNKILIDPVEGLTTGIKLFNDTTGANEITLKNHNLTTGDKIQGLCSAASSIDFTINYLKQT